MATRAAVTEVKSRVDKRTTELLKHMETHIKKSSEASIRNLREAIEREKKYLEASSAISESTAAQAKGLQNPPNVAFHKPAEKKQALADVLPWQTEFKVTRPLSAEPSALCWTSLFLPPYIGGIPDVPQSTSTPNAGVVFFEEISPEYGGLELLAVTFNDDSTARSDGTMVQKVASDRLFVGESRLGSIPGPATLTVTAPVHTSGNTLVLARGLATPTGAGLIRYLLRLSVLLLKADGNVNIADSEMTPLCRVAAPPPAFAYDQGVQNFVSDNVLTASLPVSTGDLALVGLHAELYVGVSPTSNLYVDGNFSHLRSFFQGPGFISVPDVGIAVC